jgi:hypothetical protein
MMAAAALLEEGCKAALGLKVPTHALDNAAAVAALASALTSFTKRTAQFTKAAIGMRMPQRVDMPLAGSGRFLLWGDMAVSAAAAFPAAVPELYLLLQNMAVALLSLTTPSSSLSSGSITRQMQNVAGSAATSASSSSTQGRVSSTLLAVVIIRSAIQIADAMQAAGPELLFGAQKVRPACFGAQNTALNEFDSYIAAAVTHIAAPVAAPGLRQQQPSVLQQWQLWQQMVLRSLQGALGALKVLRIVTQLGGAEFAEDAGSSSTSASASSSSSSQQAKWSHLLQLQYSSKVAAAVTTFEGKWHDWFYDQSMYSGTAAAAEKAGEMYADVLGLCRAVAAAAPLHGVCNYVGCENLASVSEAAACAGKTCAACKASYCSVACQKADWPLHKHACKRLTAAGERCW